jgi:hypothetical protein
MTSENQSSILELMEKLLLVSKNSDEVISLSVVENLGKDLAKCVGLALRDNTQIESLALQFDLSDFQRDLDRNFGATNSSLSEPAVDQSVLITNPTRDIAKFIATSPSLTELTLGRYRGDGSCPVIGSLLRAAATNTSIECLSLTYFHSQITEDLSFLLETSRTLSQLHIECWPYSDYPTYNQKTQLANAFAVNSSVKQLSLRRSNGLLPTLRRSNGLLPTIFAGLAASSSSVLKELTVDWAYEMEGSENLGALLSSRNISLEVLHLKCGELEVYPNGASHVDHLVAGLRMSSSMKTLGIIDYQFDREEFQKLWNAVQQSHVSDMAFEYNYATNGSYIGWPWAGHVYVADLSSLDKLSITKGPWLESLANCTTLTELTYSDISYEDHPPVDLAWDLTCEVLSTQYNLASLCFSDRDFPDEYTDILVRMIQNTSCNLNKLTLSRCWFASKEQLTKIIKALRFNVNLVSLSFAELRASDYDDVNATELVWDVLLSNFDALQNIMSLSITRMSLSNEHRRGPIPPGDRLLGLLKTNTSLERFEILINLSRKIRSEL